MLGKYKDGKHFGYSVIANLKTENKEESKTAPITTPKTDTKNNEALKPPGVDEDDESDEDLSYLL